MRGPRRWVLVAATVVTVAVNVVPGLASATPTAAPRIYGWGDNSSGQLSLGLPSEVLGPAVLPAMGDAAPGRVAAGFGFSLALLADGSVWSWGENSHGQLGTGAPLTSHPSPPAQIVTLSNIVQVSAGAFSAAAVDSSGYVWTWGANWFAQLGNGSRVDSSVPVKLSSPVGVVRVSVGENHTLALRSNGEVWGWGANDLGQLGVASPLVAERPIRTSAPYGVVQIEAGSDVSMVLRSPALGGGVFTFGYNDHGQIGNNIRTDQPQVTPVLAMRNATAISLGRFSSFAIDAGGHLWAWGLNECGSLNLPGPTGDPTVPGYQLVPKQTSLGGVVSVDGGLDAGIATGPDGTVWRWGLDAPWLCSHPYADGHITQTPIPVPGLTAVTSASLSQYDTFLAVAAAPQTVPNVIGLYEGQATAILQAGGFSVHEGSLVDNSWCLNVGNVGYQDPNPGTELPAGATVWIYVYVPPNTGCD